MPNSTTYNILEACRQPGCPLCQLEAKSVERYLDNHFYESVNSPKWRESLRASLGFCHEHAWLGVSQRLGDALGYSIIYHDIVNSVLAGLQDGHPTAHAASRRLSFLKQLPESARERIEKILDVLTPRKRCPVCDHRDHTTRTVLSALVVELKSPDMIQALQSSDGLCLPHLRSALEHMKDASVIEPLLQVHRAKLESLKAELAEFIRKNDYQAVKEGFGKEGDAWLRAVALIVGRRKDE